MQRVPSVNSRTAKSLRPGLLPSPWSNTFTQKSILYKRPYSPLRTYRRHIYSEVGRQGWDFGRFVKTLYFFNGPPNPAKVSLLHPDHLKMWTYFLKICLTRFIYMKFFEFLIAKLSNPSPSQIVNKMDTSGIILVAGATGGVGRRVVDILRNRGLPVRALVFSFFYSWSICNFIYFSLWHIYVTRA